MWVARSSVPSGSAGSSTSGQDVVHPPLHVALAHPHRDAPVEHLHHRHRVHLAAVDAADRDGAAAADRLERGVQGVEPVDGHLVDEGLGQRVRQQADGGLGGLARGEPCASMPTASTTPSGPRPPVISIRVSATSSTSLRSSVSMPCGAASASRSGTRSTPITRPAPSCLAIRVANWPTGPRPRTATVPPARDLGELHALPRGRQDVGQVEEPLVRVLVGHLDRAELGLRHAQVLGLPAGHRAVQAGVAEQARALALVAHLGGLALGVEAALAHPAVAAGDVERDDDAVAGLDVGDVGADLLDDAHRLVAEDVARGEVGAQDLVEVQVRPADRGRGDLDDRVGRLSSRGSRTSSTRTSRLPCQVSALTWFAPVRRGVGSLPTVQRRGPLRASRSPSADQEPAHVLRAGALSPALSLGARSGALSPARRRPDRRRGAASTHSGLMLRILPGVRAVVERHHPRASSMPRSWRLAGVEGGQPVTEQVDAAFVAAVAGLGEDGARRRRSGRCRRAARVELFDAQVAQPAPRPRGPLAARAGRGLLHDRLGGPRGERRGGARRCGPPTRRCCTTARAPSTSSARARAGQRRGARHAARAASPRATSRSPAAGTRCSAATTWRCIPQTSTIASHLPRAVGVAFAIERAPRLGLERRGRADAVVVCSLRRRLGQPRDRAGALNTAAHLAYQGPAAAAALRLRGQRARDQRAARRRAGSSRRLRGGRGCATRTPTATIWPRRCEAADGAGRLGPRRRRPGVAAPAHRAADGPRRVRRGERPTARRREIRADWRATRCSPPPGCCSTRGRSRRRDPGALRARARVRRSPREAAACRGSHGRGGDGAARPAPRRRGARPRGRRPSATAGGLRRPLPEDEAR